MTVGIPGTFPGKPKHSFGNKASKTKKRIMVLLVVLLLVSLLITVCATAVGNISQQNQQQASIQTAEQTAAASDGMSDDDLASYQAASEQSTLGWELTGAIDRAAGDWTAAGDPPYGIDNLKDLNKQLQQNGLEALSESDAQDRVTAGTAIGQLILSMMAADHPGVETRVDAGVSVIRDPQNPSGWVQGIDPDNSDAQQVHDDTRAAFVDVIKKLALSTTVTESAGTIFDTAYRWVVGAKQASTGGGTGGQGSQLKPGSVPAEYVQWVNQAGSICPEITPPIIAAQIFVESSFKDHPPNAAGAAGPGQFIASTWAQYGVDADNNGTKDLHSVADAVVTTGVLDCALVKQLGSKVPDKDPVELALAGYNAGAGAVLQYRGIPPYPETQSCVSKILDLAANQFTDPNATCGGDSGTTGPTSGWVNPVPKGWTVGAVFHQMGPWTWMGWHTGYDFAIAIGTPVMAAADGTVAEINHNGQNPHGNAWGNQIIISHGKMQTANGVRYITTTYNHLQDFTVKVGDHVKAGQVIGHVGLTGNTFGPHLHFEVHDSKTPSFNWANPAADDFLDPWQWLQSHRGKASAAGSGDSGVTDSISNTSSGDCGSGGTTPASGVVGAVIKAAKAQMGVPYSWGGGTINGPSRGSAQGANTVGFDCSSLVMYAWYQGTGKTLILPRITNDQVASNQVSAVPLAKIQPGDLIFFKIPGEAGWGHVGLYIGGGNMIEAPHTGANVRISSITTGYYADIPSTVRRVKTQVLS